MVVSNKSLESLLRRYLLAFAVTFVFVSILLIMPVETVVHYLPYADLAAWKYRVDKEMSLVVLHKVAAPHIFAIAIRQSIRTYLKYIQSVTVLIITGYFLPRLFNQLYVVAPDWITDITDNIITDMGRSFSADEGAEVPDLVLDDSLINTFSGSKDSYGDFDGSGSPQVDRRVRSFTEEDVANFDRISAASKIWMQEKTVDECAGEDFVFDAQYGVVPRSSRDRWKELAEERRSAEKESKKAKRKIPPVRYSQGDD